MQRGAVSFRAFKRGPDLEAVLALLSALNRHEAALGAPRKLDRDSVQHCLEEDIRKIRLWGGQQIVALRDGSIVGYMAVTFGEASPVIPDAIRQHVFIENLIVSEEARRLGIGGALLNRAETLAREQGFHALCLGMVPGNGVAEAVYRAAGFTPVAIEMRKVLD